MSLKKLNTMTMFNNEEFFANKEYQLFNIEPWKDYDSDKVLGAKYRVVIYADHSNYGGDVGVTNAGESLTVKVKGAKAIQYDGTARYVRLINPRGTIYGEYRNQLSVRADGVELLEDEE